MMIFWMVYLRIHWSIIKVSDSTGKSIPFIFDEMEGALDEKPEKSTRM